MKRILHVCLSGIYNDGWGYQENIMSEYDARQGFKVFLIASKEGVIDTNSKILADKTIRYTRNNVNIIRIPFSRFLPKKMASKLKIYGMLTKIIKEINADIIFYHGTIGFPLSTIPAVYKSNPSCIIYIDNHADYYNCCKNLLSKFFYKYIWRIQIARTLPYVEKYFGTLPIRNKFMEDIYHIPKEKIELLIMGIDEASLPKNSIEARKTFREKYKIDDNTFLIVTGGKIDANKNICNVIDACKSLKKYNIRLVIFGKIEDEFIQEFNRHLNDNILFIKWLSPEEINTCFAAADLGVFPGLHSVLWEQAVASKLPCIFHKLDGVEHVNFNGNCILLDNVSTNYLYDILKELYLDKTKYNQLKNNAIQAFHYVLYKEIEKKYIK